MIPSYALHQEKHSFFFYLHLATFPTIVLPVFHSHLCQRHEKGLMTGDEYTRNHSHFLPLCKIIRNSLGTFPFGS